MFKMFDFECKGCDWEFEELVCPNEAAVCPNCRSKDTTQVIRSIPKTFETIRATTLTSKKYKAGYVDQYNRPATKISSAVPRSYSAS
jgi:putative FmdB family regulatory protein